MENTVASKTYKGYDINVYFDYDADSPRELFDGLGTIYSNHKNYSPDNHGIEELMEKFGCNGIKELISTIEKEKKYIYLPIYAYIHSGITINTSGYSDPWDSGFFGIIMVDKTDDECNGMTDEQIKNCLQTEVEDLDAYYTGQVFRYEVINTVGECIDSLNGIYGDTNYAIEEAQRYIDGLPGEDEIKNELGEKSVEELQNIVFEILTEAPSWVLEVMELVEENKLKSWFIQTIFDNCRIAEIRDMI